MSSTVGKSENHNTYKSLAEVDHASQSVGLLSDIIGVQENLLSQWFKQMYTFMTNGQEPWALFVMFISAFMLSVQGLFLQLANNDGIGFQIGELIFARCFVQAIFSVFMLFAKNEPYFGNSSSRIYVLLRGFFGGLCTGLWFFATIVLPLGDAIALISLHPILTCVVSFCLLDERLSVVHFASLAFCIIGAFLICQPDFIFNENLDDKETHLGYIASFSAAFCYTVIFICMRKAQDVDPFSLMFSLACFGSVLGGVLMSYEQNHFAGDYRYLTVAIITGLISQWTLNYAGRMCRAGLGSIVRSSDIVWAYMFQIFIFHESVNLYTILGFLSVLLSVFFIGTESVLNDTSNEDEQQENLLVI